MYGDYQLNRQMMNKIVPFFYFQGSTVVIHQRLSAQTSSNQFWQKPLTIICYEAFRAESF